jgi:hypothetical protein
MMCLMMVVVVTAELPELEPAFMALGQLMINVGMRVALHCDAYVHSKLPVYKRRTLHEYDHHYLSFFYSCNK